MNTERNSGVAKHKPMMDFPGTDQRPEKIRKVVSSTPSQPMNISQNDSVAKSTQELDLLMDVWNKSSQTNVFLSQEVQLKEMKERLAHSELRVQKLQRSLNEAQENYCALTASTNDELKTREEIVEKLQISWNLTSLIDDHFGVMTGTLQRCIESKDQLNEMYDQVLLKQQEKIKRLTDDFNEEVRKEKEQLQRLLDVRTNQLLEVQDKYKKIEDDAADKSQILVECENKLQRLETTFLESKNQYEREMSKLTSAMKHAEDRVLVEQSERAKMKTEKEEILHQLEEFQFRFKTIELTASEYKIQIEKLELNLAEQKDREVNLSVELDTIKQTHAESISKHDMETVDYSNQLRSLQELYATAMSKFNEVNSWNTELKDNITKLTEQMEHMRIMLKNKDDELVKMRTNLNSILERNDELSKTIDTIAQKLSAEEEISRQARADIEIYKLQRNENIAVESQMEENMVRIQQQLKEALEKCDAFKVEIEQMRDEKMKLIGDAAKMTADIEHKNSQISFMEKALDDLRKDKEISESNSSSKIGDLTTSLKKIELEFEQARKEHATVVATLRQELVLVLNADDARKAEAEKRAAEKAKCETQLKELEKKYDELNKRLSTQQENDDIKNKSKDAESSVELKNTAESRGHLERAEVVPYTSTPRPILKSPKNTFPGKFQRVQFDFDDINDMSSIHGGDAEITPYIKPVTVTRGQPRGKFFNRPPRGDKSKSPKMKTNKEFFIFDA